MTELEELHAYGVLMRVAYHGGGYHGFAPQSRVETIGGLISKAIERVDPNASSIRFVSRTDAGVHAQAQLIAFDTTRRIGSRGWVLAVAQHLPDAISPRSAAIVPVKFEPRHHVLSKCYRYTLLIDRLRDPFWRQTAWRVGHCVDLKAARVEAQTIIGTHDFKAFRSSMDARTNTIRTIRSISIIETNDPRVVFIDITGDGFMHNMVRIIVGTLLDVARGVLALGTMQKALDCGDRRCLGVTAPAHGLCLQKVQLQSSVELVDCWPRAEDMTNSEA